MGNSSCEKCGEIDWVESDCLQQGLPIGERGWGSIVQDPTKKKLTAKCHWHGTKFATNRAKRRIHAGTKFARTRELAKKRETDIAEKKTSNSQPVQTGLGLLYQRRRAAIQPPMDLSAARRRGQGAGGGRWRRGWGKGSRAILWKGGHEKLGRGGREVMGGGVAVGTGGAVITLLPPLVSWVYNESRAGLWRGPGLADKRGEGGLVI
jgi:hypothetical protein